MNCAAAFSLDGPSAARKSGSEKSLGRKIELLGTATDAGAGATLGSLGAATALDPAALNLRPMLDTPSKVRSRRAVMSPNAGCISGASMEREAIGAHAGSASAATNGERTSACGRGEVFRAELGGAPGGADPRASRDLTLSVRAVS